MYGKPPISFKLRRNSWALGILFSGFALSGCGMKMGLTQQDLLPLLGKASSASTGPQDLGRPSQPSQPFLPQPSEPPSATTHPSDDGEFGFSRDNKKKPIAFPPVQQKSSDEPEGPWARPLPPDDFPRGGYGGRGGPGGGYGGSGYGEQGGTASQDDSPLQVGERCTAGASSMCLGLRYVVFVNPRNQEAVEDRADVEENLQDVNRIWSECGVGFQVERFEQVRPEQFDLRYQTADYDELNDIRRVFNDEHRLLVVLTGPWNRRGTLGGTYANAWTNLPGEGIYGSILEGPMRQTPNMIAHELGHYLGLGHVQDASDLMNPLIAPITRRLDPDQCAEARRVARSAWAPMLRHSR